MQTATAAQLKSSYQPAAFHDFAPPCASLQHALAAPQEHSVQPSGAAGHTVHHFGHDQDTQVFQQSFHQQQLCYETSEHGAPQQLHLGEPPLLVYNNSLGGHHYQLEGEHDGQQRLMTIYSNPPTVYYDSSAAAAAAEQTVASLTLSGPPGAGHLSHQVAGHREIDFVNAHPQHEEAFALGGGQQQNCDCCNQQAAAYAPSSPLGQQAAVYAHPHHQQQVDKLHDEQQVSYHTLELAPSAPANRSATPLATGAYEQQQDDNNNHYQLYPTLEAHQHFEQHHLQAQPAVEQHDPHTAQTATSSSSSTSSGLSSSASSTHSNVCSSEVESFSSQLSRDERKAREANIPLSYYEIVNLSIDQFNEFIGKHNFSESQLSLMKDIRRRGKNKVAAQTCRKRKMEQIVELQQEVGQLANKRRRLIGEKSRLAAEYNQLVQEYNRLYSAIQEKMGSLQTGDPIQQQLQQPAALGQQQ